MNTQLYHFKAARNLLTKLIDELSDEQLNTIPKGYNNNLAWHLGHLLVTQQLLQYKLSGLPLKISDELVEAYRKGTKADGPYPPEQIALIKELLNKAPEWLEEDLAAGRFTKYQEYPTSFGVTLSSIDDALAFNNVHEGLHLGYMMSMKRTVLNA